MCSFQYIKFSASTVTNINGASNDAIWDTSSGYIRNTGQPSAPPLSTEVVGTLDVPDARSGDSIDIMADLQIEIVDMLYRKECN